MNKKVAYISARASRHNNSKFCAAGGLLNHYAAAYFERGIRPDSDVLCHYAVVRRCSDAFSDESLAQQPYLLVRPPMVSDSYIESESPDHAYFARPYWERQGLLEAAAASLKTPYDIIRIANKGLALRSHHGIESAVDLLANVGDSSLLCLVVESSAFNFSLKRGRDAEYRAGIVAKAIGKSVTVKADEKVILLDNILAQNRHPVVAEAYVDAHVDLFNLGYPLHDVVRRLDRVATAYGTIGGIAEIAEDAKAMISD